MSVTPPCRACGTNENVGCYREDAPEKTICPSCCESAEHDDGETGHQFTYHRSEGSTCDYCGVNRNDTLWEPADDYFDDPA